jgi:heptosyltransferase III
VGKSSERLACLILGRNLGDIVVQSGFVKRLVDASYAERYLIWTRPQLAFLFKDMRDCTVVCSQFPVGTAKHFTTGEALRFLTAVRAIRRQRPSVSLDFVGDLRERWFSRLIGSPHHLHIGWMLDHPYARLIRNPLGPGHPLVTISTHVQNVYDAYEKFVDALVPQQNYRQQMARHSPNASVGLHGLKIGIHPFASQPSKLWPSENWQRLTRELLSQGASVTAFGAPHERQALRSIFAPFGAAVGFFASSLESFADEVANFDVIVGLDSFSVHMAHRQGVPSVTINAGTPASLWAVPSGITLGASGGCAYFPCYNVPKCRQTTYEFACVKSTSPQQVMDAIANRGKPRIAPGP